MAHQRGNLEQGAPRAAPGTATEFSPTYEDKTMSEPTKNKYSCPYMPKCIAAVIKTIVECDQVRQDLNAILMRESGGTISIVTRARPRKPGKKGGKA